MDNTNNLYGLDLDSMEISLLDRSIKKIIDYDYVINIYGSLINATLIGCIREGGVIIAENVKDANVYGDGGDIGILIRQFV